MIVYTNFLFLSRVFLQKVCFFCEIKQTPQKRGLFGIGASGRNRTIDTRIFSPLLYRLSYRGKALAGYKIKNFALRTKPEYTKSCYRAVRFNIPHNYVRVGCRNCRLERATRLELATSTLARWRSTR